MATLETAERAFERGDWRTARAEARRALASGDEAERAAAQAMLDRFRPDLQLAALFLLALVGFLAVVLAFWRG